MSRPQELRIPTALHLAPVFPVSVPMATASSSRPANAEQRYEVRRSDLPLSCPMPDMALWNSHPKVYLPIEASGEASCPYCGARYVLIG